MNSSTQQDFAPKGLISCGLESGREDLVKTKSRSSTRNTELIPVAEEYENEVEDYWHGPEEAKWEKSQSAIFRSSHLSNQSLGKWANTKQLRSTDSQSTNYDAEENPDTDLEDEIEEKASYLEICRNLYMERCRRLGVVPVSFFVRHMHEEELIMKHHGLGPVGAKAIAISLCSNTSIGKLDLEDNSIGPNGADSLAEMLKDNCYITELDISNNEIGSEGARLICRMLEEDNRYLKSLSLSGNYLQDKDAEHVARVLMENTQLNQLDLSHNEFCEIGGAKIGSAIGENDSLEYLDLRWNHLRRSGSIRLLQGVKINTHLKYLNLAFNGLGNESAMAVMDVLKNNEVLSELDVSDNRISTEGALIIAKGLTVNGTLKTFRIGNNPIETTGTNAILKSIYNEKNMLECLDLSNISVDQDFVKLKNEILQSRSNLDIIHGPVMGDSDSLSSKLTMFNSDEEAMKDLCNIFDTNEKDFLATDPMAIIRAYVDKHNLRLLDLFNSIDKDRNFKISKEEFINGIKSVGIILNKAQIKVLMKKLNVPNDGLIDFREIAVGDRKTKEQRRVMARLDQDIRRLSLGAARPFPSVQEVLALRKLSESVKRRLSTTPLINSQRRRQSVAI